MEMVKRKIYSITMVIKDIKITKEETNRLTGKTKPKRIELRRDQHLKK